MMRESSKNHAGIMARLDTKQKCPPPTPADRPSDTNPGGLASRFGHGRSCTQPPGWKGLPSEAGMLIRIQTGLREISTSTTMVAR